MASVHVALVSCWVLRAQALLFRLACVGTTLPGGWVRYQDAHSALSHKRYDDRAHGSQH